MTNTTDYATSHFKYPTPTPINWEPTNKLLKRIKTDLRADASSINTDLGGGYQGYLGLFLTDSKYTCIKPKLTDFVAPNFPALLVIADTATAVEAMQKCGTNKD